MEDLKLTDGTIARCSSSAHLVTQSCFWGHQLHEAAWTLCFKALCKSLLWIKMKYYSADCKNALTPSHEAPRVASLCWRWGTSCGQLFFNLFRSQPHFKRSATLTSYWGLSSPFHPSPPGCPASLPYGPLPPQKKHEYECKETQGDLFYSKSLFACVSSFWALIHPTGAARDKKDRIWSRFNDNKNRKMLQGQRSSCSFAPQVAILPVKKSV